MPRILASCVLLLMVAASVAVSYAGEAEDWPQWRGPRRDGISHETGWTVQWPEDGPPRLWQRALGKGLASVAVSQGRLYTLGNMNGTASVWCLDAATGEVKWRRQYKSRLWGSFPGPAATPTVDGGRVYTLGRAGDLLCLEAVSGKVVWARNVRKDFGVPSQRPDYGHCSSPLVVGQRVIVEVGAPDGLVFAFDKATGEVAWKGAKGGKFSYSSPALVGEGDGQRVAVFHAFGLGVFDLENGREVWRYPWKTYDLCSVATPIVMGNRILISSAYGRGAALLEIGKDKPVWFTRELMCHHATCVLWKRHLYGFHGDRRDPGELRCLDVATGKVKWSQGGMGKGTVLLAGGRLLVLSQKGELLAADASPDGFKPLARARVLRGLCWTTPVLCKGRLYCRDLPGELVCLDLRPPR